MIGKIIKLRKLLLRTIDQDEEYEYKTATVYSKDYTKEIKKNTIHTPNAAKVIFETEDQLISLILMQPIIKSDEHGEIEIYTASTFAQATLMEKYIEENINYKKLKNEVKLLGEQHKVGLTVPEIMKMNDDVALFESALLERRNEREDKGGGF